VTRPFLLEIERPLDIARQDEVALLRKAVAANPVSRELRFKLAMRLFVQDAFDEVIDLLEVLFEEAAEPRFARYLAEAYLSRETPVDDRRAEVFARIAHEKVENPIQRAGALATLGKALTRQGRLDEARTALATALAADPHDRNAYKRLAALDLRARAPEDALNFADDLIARGVGHSRLLGARAIALTKLERIEEARAAVGLDRFLHSRILSAPPAWQDLAALNAAVTEELHRHPDLRFDRYGTASSKTWRVDEPAFANSVAIPALQALIRQAVIDHVASLDIHDTPWTNARPERATLHNWCVLTDADGHEEWHVHQNGWMSGVYYVHVPPMVRGGAARAGCIAFGMPEDQVGSAGAENFGETLVRPQPGLLMFFPSHCFHRTFPHGSEQRRICLAFDIRPA
jgi:tetratricopeptide (TPR) repeat protein